MLAYDTERNAGSASQFEHLARIIEIRRDRFLDQNGPSNLGTDSHRLQVKIRKGADINVIEAWITTEFFVIRNELRAPAIRKLDAAGFGLVGARDDLESDISIGLRVFISDSASSEDAHFHVSISSPGNVRLALGISVFVQACAGCQLKAQCPFRRY